MGKNIYPGKLNFLRSGETGLLTGVIHSFVGIRSGHRSPPEVGFIYRRALLFGGGD